MRGRNGLLIAFCAVVAFLPAFAQAKVTVRDPGTFVVDQAGIIDSQTKKRLEAILIELQQKTSAQVKVLTVQSVDGEDWFGWVQRHFDTWKLGQKGKDNGVLIALTVKERKVRIHPGYGLEPVLPDSWTGTLSRKVASDYFKQGQYSQGLLLLTGMVASKVAAASNVQLSGVPKMSGRRSGRRNRAPGLLCGGGFAPIFIIFIIISSIGRRRRHYGRWGGGGLMQGLFLGSIFSSMTRGSGSHWGGGGFGGSSGFGGGGFFGGGGMSGGGGGGASW